jgi:hypothetical protein
MYITLITLIRRTSVLTSNLCIYKYIPIYAFKYFVHFRSADHSKPSIFIIFYHEDAGVRQNKTREKERERKREELAGCMFLSDES